MDNNIEFDSEATAISLIVKALADLEESRKIAVLAYIMQRMGASISTENHKIINTDTSEKSEGNIKAFLKAKDPQNSYQQVAVLAYYLKKIKGELSINKNLIEAANIEADGRTIDDITGVLNDAKSKYHYFGSSAGGKKNLLAYGEDIVDVLPNQEAVKALASKRPKKKRVKKVAKK